MILSKQVATGLLPPDDLSSFEETDPTLDEMLHSIAPSFTDSAAASEFVDHNFNDTDMVDVASLIVPMPAFPNLDSIQDCWVKRNTTMVPTPDDVLFGRGRSIQETPGNIAFVNLIESLYLWLSKGSKHRIMDGF